MQSDCQFTRAIAGTSLQPRREGVHAAAAGTLRSKNMYPALVLDLNCGLRDKELRELRWRRI